jgi:uncharacterized protein YecE (DUF72 family)
MPRVNRNRFYCGTSNVELPVPNKAHFPEEFRDKTRLNYYASIFNTVEINSSFYKIPLRRTVEKWAADVPDDFRFTFKMWRGITHTKGLVYDATDIHRFMTSVNGIGIKKGCLLLQFPASIKISYFQKLRQLLDDLYRDSEIQQWKVAVEFRDKSWYNDTVYQLLEHYHASVVIHDIPASSTPLIDMEASFVYLRFHGIQGDYRGSYANTYLQEQGAYITDWLKEGKTVFAYFNNTIGDAVQNAIALQQQLK